MGNILILGLFWQLSAAWQQGLYQTVLRAFAVFILLSGECARSHHLLARPSVTWSPGRRSPPTATGWTAQVLEILRPRRGRQHTPQVRPAFSFDPELPVEVERIRGRGQRT